MRLSIIRVNWEICCWPVDDHHGRNCAIAVQFCPRGLALPSFVALPLVCFLPPASWFMVDPCVQVSTLILHWEFRVAGVRGRWPTGGCHGYPFIFILPTLACSLPALLSIGTYTPFWILLIDKLTSIVSEHPYCKQNLDCNVTQCDALSAHTNKNYRKVRAWYQLR